MQESKVTKVLLQLVPVLGVSVALISFLTTVQSKKKELSVSYLGSDPLIAVDSGPATSDLKVDYKGSAVKSLNKMNFAIRNTGSVAIKAEDVKEPLTLSFQNGVNILSALVERTRPTLTFRTVASAGANSVSFDFPLLNPGDEAFVAVYVYNSVPTMPQVTGRIVDVKQIEQADSSGNRHPAPLGFVTQTGARRTVFWTLIVVNIVAAGLMCFALVAVADDFRKGRKWKSRWQQAYDAARTEYNEKNFPGNTVRFPPPLDYLSEKGIPPKEYPLADSWGELSGFILVFSGLAIAWVLTALSQYSSIRSFP